MASPPAAFISSTTASAGDKDPSEDPSTFHLTLESTGSLPASDILSEATNILNTKLNEITESVKESV